MKLEIEITEDEIRSAIERTSAMLAALDEDERRQVLEALTEEERAALAEFKQVPGNG